MVFLLLVSVYVGIVCLTYTLRHFKQYLGMLVVSKTQHYFGLKRGVTIVWLFNLIKSPKAELSITDGVKGCFIPWY